MLNSTALLLEGGSGLKLLELEPPLQALLALGRVLPLLELERLEAD